MNISLQELPVEERIRMVEDIWDSIAADKSVLTLTAEQRAELDRRLNAYEVDGKRGRLATEAIADIRRKL
jgi:putative addiction module component (TIGR02574 family)